MTGPTRLSRAQRQVSRPVPRVGTRDLESRKPILTTASSVLFHHPERQPSSKKRLLAQTLQCSRQRSVVVGEFGFSFCCCHLWRAPSPSTLTVLFALSFAEWMLPRLLSPNFGARTKWRFSEQPTLCRSLLRRDDDPTDRFLPHFVRHAHRVSSLEQENEQIRLENQHLRAIVASQGRTTM